MTGAAYGAWGYNVPRRPRHLSVVVRPSTVRYRDVGTQALARASCQIGARAARPAGCATRLPGQSRPAHQAAWRARMDPVRRGPRLPSLREGDDVCRPDRLRITRLP